MQKFNFATPPPHTFLEILQWYANLFWVPCVCLVAHTKNDSINLKKTSMFIYIPKINFIIHIFLEILHFKESSILAHNLQTRILPDMGLVVKYQHNVSFHFRLFPRKTNNKIFQKIPKTLYWSHFGRFCPNLGKNEFSWKKLSVSFKIF